VNTGTPVLASQLNWNEASRDPIAEFPVASLQGAPARIGMPASNELINLLARAMYLNTTFSNVLDFRPDLQMRMSTAAALTARFPYVTPLAILNRSADIELDKRIFLDLKRLELVDGGFWDNGGTAAVNSLIARLSEAMARADASPATPARIKRGDVEFQVISLTHADVYLNRPGTATETSELFLPLTVFDRVRVSRGALGGQLNKEHIAAVHSVSLFDQNFEAPLSWVLAGDTKHAIEVRSGLTKSATADDEICCVVTFEFPGPGGTDLADSIVPIPREEVDLFERQLEPPGMIRQGGWMLSVGPHARTKAAPYLPNARVFDAILAALRANNPGPSTSSTNGAPSSPKSGSVVTPPAAP
jgi:hypothetical protein